MRCTEDCAVVLKIGDERSSQPFKPIAEDEVGEPGLESLGDKALMRISACEEIRPWRIGSLQSRNGPSAVEFVVDVVIVRGGVFLFGETACGDPGDSGGSSRYHKLCAP